MRYVATNEDGSVAVIVLVPARIFRHADGLMVIVQGVRKNEPRNGRPGETVLYGAVSVDGQVRAAQVVVGDENFDVGDLEEDSLPGHQILFPDIHRDVLRKLVPESRARVKAVRPCRKADIPSDRTFRDAWRDRGATVEVDMPAAREIHRERMRVARKPLLEALDIDYQRADEAGSADAKSDIAARKQALRDVTDEPLIEAARTPEELHAVWPQMLGERRWR